MDVAFSNINFQPLMITVGYDQTLNVYSFSGEDHYVNKFNYKNNDSELGYFTHVVFDKK